jgi:hypothetical protein
MARTSIVCEQCHRRFLAEHDAEPVCPALYCQARAHWTVEQWQGQARMAEARQVAHGYMALDALDKDALARERKRVRSSA